jgi:hypothetical protein
MVTFSTKCNRLISGSTSIFITPGFSGKKPIIEQPGVETFQRSFPQDPGKFCTPFCSIGIDLPVFACWCVAIGGFANPTVFTIAAFDPDFWKKKHWRLYTISSFLITTIGFLGIGYALLINGVN